MKAEDFFTENNGGKSSKQSVAEGETFTAAYVVEFAKRFAREARKSKNELPEYKDFIRLWDQYYKEIGLKMPRDGAKVKSIINQTRLYIHNGGKESTPENVIHFWEYFLQRLKSNWAHGKSLAVIESHYTSIIFELKHGKKKDDFNSRNSAERMFSNYAN